jgi:uncharacterized protein YkwD
MLSMLGDARVHSYGRYAVLALATCTLTTIACAPASAVPAQSPPAPATPGTTIDYRQLERDVFAELNAARTNPTGYAARVAATLPDYHGNLLTRPGWPVAVRTVEGTAAAREAIAALRAQPRENALVLDEGLSRAARVLADDQSRTGAVGHTASDGSSPSDRISRFGTWGLSNAENVDYGHAASGRDIVEDLVIDDGVRDRGHRRNVFDPAAHVVGIACAPHPRYGTVCVIDQAGVFTAR